MSKGRLEAFSDGVMAIIITIMVLEMKAPHEASWEALRPVLPAFLSYVLSFIYVGIYWNNHHHLYHAVERVSGMALWGNLHVLFWLSLFPFVTAWMGETHFESWPVVAYGVVLLMAAIAWEIQHRVLLRHHDRNSAYGRAMGRSNKEWLSLAIYAAAIGLAFANSLVACALYALVAAIWFIPDRRIERELGTHSTRPTESSR
jgi:uncharacterized membrane protein